MFDFPWSILSVVGFSLVAFTIGWCLADRDRRKGIRRLGDAVEKVRQKFCLLENAMSIFIKPNQTKADSFRRQALSVGWLERELLFLGNCMDDYTRRLKENSNKTKR